MGAIDDPTERKKRVARRWRVGLALVVGVVAAPFVVAGIEGLAGLFVIWLLTTVAVQFAPVISMKVANLRLKAIKAEAEKNPIETMEATYAEKSEVIRAGDEKIVAFESRYRTYLDQLDDFKEKHPSKADRFVQIARTMGTGLKRMKQKQAAAKEEQKAYWDKISEARAIFAMALAAQAVSELSATAEQQVFQDIKRQVAFDAVNTAFNRAVAELSLDVEDPKEFSQELLTSTGGEVPRLEASPSSLPESAATSDTSARTRR